MAAAAAIIGVVLLSVNIFNSLYTEKKKRKKLEKKRDNTHTQKKKKKSMPLYVLHQFYIFMYYNR